MKTIATLAFRILVISNLLAMVCRPAPVHAAEALTDVHGTGPGGPWFGNDNTVGWMFDALVPIEVTHLGVFNINGIGGTPVFQTHQVGIWDASGSLLLSGTVGTGSGDTLLGVWQYTSVAPAILNPGRYVIGAQYVVGSPDWVVAQPSTTDPALAFVGARIGTGSNLPFPDQADANLFVGPNFEFTAVPEPKVGLLLLAGSLAVIRQIRSSKSENRNKF